MRLCKRNGLLVLFPTFFVTVCLGANIHNRSPHETSNIDLDLIAFVKRQSGEKSSFRMESSGSSHTSPPSLTRRTESMRSLSKEDKKALAAARLFFDKENVSLADAMKKHKVPSKNSHDSMSGSHSIHSTGNSDSIHHQIGMRDASPEVLPFSKDVLRHTQTRRPKGYDSNEQIVARHAERLLKKGIVVDTKTAVEEGKTKVQQRIERRNKELNHWRDLAHTDPSQARQMTRMVPKALSRAQYIPLRAHQLHHQGKAQDLDSATQMATKESQDFSLRKKLDNARRTRRGKKTQ